MYSTAESGFAAGCVGFCRSCKVEDWKSRRTNGDGEEVEKASKV